MAFFYGVCYFLGGKLHGDRDIQSRYGYRLLGALPQPRQRKTMHGIDNWLAKLSGTPAISETEGIYRRISQNVANLAGEHKKILVTGTVQLEKLRMVANAITEHTKDFVLIVAENMNRYPDALKSLAECDVVLLIEERECSFLSDIKKEYEDITALAKPVIGYVLL